MSPAMQRVVELARGIQQRVADGLGLHGPEPGGSKAGLSEGMLMHRLLQVSLD
jgi:hypothetical protein